MKRNLLQGHQVTVFCDVRDLLFPLFCGSEIKAELLLQYYKYKYYKCLLPLTMYGIYSKENWKRVELKKDCIEFRGTRKINTIK